MCLRSIHLKSSGLIVPCGSCPQCKLKRVNSWVFRLEQQARLHQTSHFITLTYAQPHITPNGFMTLYKKDYQDFMKRLRWNTKQPNIKYYAVGEYGSQSWRPHFHAIIFDIYPEDVNKAWPHGHIDVGDVNSNSIAYCCKYICKDKKIPLFPKDDRLREFALQSKKLGANYINDETIKYHKSKLNSYILKPDGHKMCLPRYYRDKIFTEAEKSILNLEAQIQQHKKEWKIIDQIGVLGFRDMKHQAYRQILKQQLYKQNLRDKV